MKLYGTVTLDINFSPFPNKIGKVKGQVLFSSLRILKKIKENAYISEGQEDLVLVASNLEVDTLAPFALSAAAALSTYLIAVCLLLVCWWTLRCSLL